MVILTLSTLSIWKGDVTIKEAGIACDKINVHQIQRFYLSYSYWWKFKKPLVTTRISLSLDGRMLGSEDECLAVADEKDHNLLIKYTVILMLYSPLYQFFYQKKPRLRHCQNLTNLFMWWTMDCSYL